MVKAHVYKAFLVGFFLTLSALGAQQASLSGRVSDSANGQGIAGLSVQLKSEGDRQVVTSTDSNGHFELRNLNSGRYVLAVLQGLTLLHREVVDVNGNMVKDVRLQRR